MAFCANEALGFGGPDRDILGACRGRAIKLAAEGSRGTLRFRESTPWRWADALEGKACHADEARQRNLAPRRPALQVTPADRRDLAYAPGRQVPKELALAHHGRGPVRDLVAL